MKINVESIDFKIFMAETLKSFNRAFSPLLAILLFFSAEKIFLILLILLLFGIPIAKYFKIYFFNNNYIWKIKNLLRIRIIEFIFLCLTILICYATKQRIICLIIILTIIIFDIIMDLYFSHKIHKKQDIKNMLK